MQELNEEFTNDKSVFFDKEGAENAITAINREYGEESEIIPDNNEGNNNTVNDAYTQRLVDKLPKSLVEKFGGLPEKIALYNLSKGLSHKEKAGLESIVNCPPETAERRLDLLDRVLTKYFGDDWTKLKQNDFIEIEILLEAWDYKETVKAGQEYVEGLKQMKEEAKS